MKDIKTQFDQFEVPVNEQAWESIANDARVMKYNKKQHLHRWAAISIPAALSIVAVVTAVVLHQPKDTNPQTTTIQTTESTIEQNNSILDETVAPEITKTHPVAHISETTESQPTSTTIKVGKDVTNTATIEPTQALAHTPVVHIPATVNNDQTAITQSSTVQAPNPTTPAQATTKQSSSNTEQTIEQPDIFKSSSNNENEEVTNSNYDLFIPNSFTPNGDGKNDLFKAVANFPVKDFEMTIFSRSGDRVFTTRNIETGWDGQKYGSVMQEDIYVYIIKYTDPDGKISSRKGQVLLLKQAR